MLLAGNRKLQPIILVVLIVILPLALLGWSARYIAIHEQAIVQQRLQQVMTQRLDDINALLVRHFEKTSRELKQLTAIDNFDVEGLRELNRREPRFLQLFVLTPKGNLLFPNPQQPLNLIETDFLLRTSKMFNDHDLKTAIALSESGEDTVEDTVQRPVQSLQIKKSNDVHSAAPPIERSSSRSIPIESSSQTADSKIASEGWFIWYWDRGENLIYWHRRPSGYLVGVALERARWMADLIGELPETNVSSTVSLKYEQSFESGLRLVDAASATIYQWGTVSSDAPTAKPYCEIAVAPPLSSWRLQCLIPPHHKNWVTGQSLQFGLWFGLVGTGVGLTALATLLLRGYARDMREASQQVSFVNHVSHELKTPLTNIRMYAELLDRDLQGLTNVETELPRQRLNVIISEGERLSRLIGNVLTFARHHRKTLQPQYRTVVPNDCVNRVLDHFRPSLIALEILVDAKLEANVECSFDPDFLEQILGNLISNVEKYASSGGRLYIDCRMKQGMLMISVEDHGPGISARQKEEIFEPFTRLDNDIHQVAGTGIGLTIARELARLHGGDLKLLDGKQGCRFEVQLKFT